MKSPGELSFLPEDYLERKARRRANVVCCVLLVLVMGAIGTSFTRNERTMREVDRAHAEVERQYTEAARRIEQVNQMKQQQARIVQQAELASSLVEKVPRSNLLAEFTNSLPPGVSLLDLTLSSNVKVETKVAPKTAFEKAKASRNAKKAAAAAPEAPKPKTYDVSIKLTGLADSDVQVAQFIAKLNQSDLLKDVNLGFTEASKLDDRVMRKFQIDVMLNPNAEIVDDPAEAGAETETETAVEPVVADAPPAPAEGEEAVPAEPTGTADAGATESAVGPNE